MHTLASSKRTKVHWFTIEYTAAMKAKKRNTVTDNHCQLIYLIFSYPEPKSQKLKCSINVDILTK